MTDFLTSVSTFFQPFLLSIFGTAVGLVAASAEGSEGHVKAEVEKGLHVKQQLAAWKISKAPAQGSIGFVWLKKKRRYRLQGPRGAVGGWFFRVLQGL